MASESTDAKPEQHEESPQERAAKQLRESQWAGETFGTRVGGGVILVAVKTQPQDKP
jgi:hypothetical protein